MNEDPVCGENVAVASVTETKHSLWHGPPPPPLVTAANDTTTHGSGSSSGSLLLLGTTLGRTLSQALQTLQQQPQQQEEEANNQSSLYTTSNHSGFEKDEGAPTTPTATTPTVQPLMRLTDSVIDRILTTLGDAMTQSYHHQPPQPVLSLQSVASVLSSSSLLAVSPSPPAVLVRGRVHHFNRQGSKWRIVLDHVQLQPRVPLPRLRRRRELSSLWRQQQQQQLSLSHHHASQDRKVATTTEAAAVAISENGAPPSVHAVARSRGGMTMELLAYNDLE